ncbi:MAG: hypothetical protein JWM06_1683 [Actinomycetia bacterium]|nr:hypothetical protein [Actinomycetes bacterium]
MSVSRDAEHRKINQSLAWRKLEQRQLAEEPVCDCGAPPVEIHRRGADCFEVGGGHDYGTDELQSVCVECHDRLCRTRTRTPFDDQLDAWLNG